MAKKVDGGDGDVMENPMKPALEIARHGDVTVIHCRAPLVAGETEELLAAATKAIAETQRLVLQLHSVPRMDSAGLGLLVRLCVSARNRSGDVMLVAPSAQVADLLQLTLKGRLFAVHSTVEAALAAFSRAAQVSA